MKITVNIMSYRYGHLAAHAIESVLSQTSQADVVCFFDDGVGDCGHLHRLYPSVEVVERPMNLGIVASFNDALWRTETERVLMLGADNYLRPDALELMAAVRVDIVSSDIALFGECLATFAPLAGATLVEGYPIWCFRADDIRRANYIHGSSLYDARIAKAVRGYSASGGKTSEEDWMLWQRMLSAGATHSHIPKPLLYYRRHKANFQTIA